MIWKKLAHCANLPVIVDSQNPDLAQCSCMMIPSKHCESIIFFPFTLVAHVFFKKCSFTVIVSRAWYFFKQIITMLCAPTRQGQRKSYFGLWHVWHEFLTFIFSPWEVVKFCLRIFREIEGLLQKQQQMSKPENLKLKMTEQWQWQRD